MNEFMKREEENERRMVIFSFFPFINLNVPFSSEYRNSTKYICTTVY